MKKNMKLLLIPCTAAALTLGSAMISFAATGWAEENGHWVYYNNDGSKATDVFKKSGNGWFYLDEDGYMACAPPPCPQPREMRSSSSTRRDT